MPIPNDDQVPTETASGPREQPPPLAVDLDFTLIRTDILSECILAYVRQEPLRAFRVLGWLTRGKGHLKRKLAEAYELDPANLPINETLVEFLRAERANGRKIHLATAADVVVAGKIANRLDLFDGVIATDGPVNIRGDAKARALKERFPDGFAYAGDDSHDVAIWREAQESVIVEASPKILAAAQEIRPPLAVFPREPLRLMTVAKALRVHQWAKNALVAVPLILGGKAYDPAAWATVLAGFLLLGVLASSTYLLNDLWDLDDDRRHWSKKHRAFASGKITIRAGMIAAPIGILVALAGAWMISHAAFAALMAYLVVTLAYSIRLKRVAVLDVFTLASLFTLRLVIGIALAAVPGSPWLLVFSMFLFSSLSFAKRHTEVHRMTQNGSSKVNGRGYIAVDAPFLMATGVAAGLSAVLVMVLYLIEEAFRAGFYSTPAALWAFPCVLFLWLGRVWTLSGRDQLHDDPVAFAVRDKTSLALGAVMALAFAVAVAPPSLVFW